MQKIASADELKTTIRQLESDQKLQASQLKSQFIQTTESLKPANLVRSAVESLIKSPWFMLIGINTIKSAGHPTFRNIGIGAGSVLSIIFFGVMINRKKRNRLISQSKGFVKIIQI